MTAGALRRRLLAQARRLPPRNRHGWNSRPETERSPAYQRPFRARVHPEDEAHTSPARASLAFTVPWSPHVRSTRTRAMCAVARLVAVPPAMRPAREHSVQRVIQVTVWTARGSGPALHPVASEGVSARSCPHALHIAKCTDHVRRHSAPACRMNSASFLADRVRAPATAGAPSPNAPRELHSRR